MNEMKKISTIKRGGLMALAGVAALGLVGAASAATITVNTTNVGVASDGKCDILEAISSALNDSNTAAASTNPTDQVCSAGSGDDTIVFSSDIAGGTITFVQPTPVSSIPTAGAFAVGNHFGATAIQIQVPATPTGPNAAGANTGSITIDGGTSGMTFARSTTCDSSTTPGASVSGCSGGRSPFRLITILGNPAATTTVATNVTLKNLTLTGGFSDGGAGGSGAVDVAAGTTGGGGGGGGGGGAGVGGAVFVGETSTTAVGGITLTLENVTIYGNRADGGDGAAAGTGSTADSSTGGGGGGGLYAGLPGTANATGNAGGAGGNEFTIAGGGGGAAGAVDGGGGGAAGALYEGGGGGGGNDANAGGAGAAGNVAASGGNTAYGNFSGGGGGGQNIAPGPGTTGGAGGAGGLFGGGGGGGLAPTTNGAAGGGGTFGGTGLGAAGGGGAGVGGGIFAYDLNSSATTGVVTVKVINSTITGNIANMGRGGSTGNTIANGGQGIGGGIATLNAALQVNNSTIANNIATTKGGGIMSLYDGSLGASGAQGDGSITLVSSILADNFVGAAAPLAIGDTPPSTADDNNALSLDLATSGGITKGTSSDNLVEKDNVGSLGVTVTDDPMLADLADNDGPTMTMALPADSPAIDMGNANGQTTDQRGEDRAVDGDGDETATADIGAYEYQPGVDPVDGSGDATADAGDTADDTTDDGTSDGTSDATDDDTGGKGDATDDTGTTDDVTGTSNTDEATSTEITAATDSTLGITAIKVSTANGVWKVAPSVSAKAKANGISYPLGIVSYSVTLDDGKGAMAEVGIDFDGGSTLDISKYKVRKEVDGTYKQMTKITSAADAKDGSYLINTANQSVTLYITDGGKWDSDASANGVVVDPVGMTSGGSSGGGGGCTLDTSSTTRDMSLLGLLGLGLVGLFRRRFFKGDAA